jgi:hypothetical protein
MRSEPLPARPGLRATFGCLPDRKSVDLSIHREQIDDLPAKLPYCQIRREQFTGSLALHPHFKNVYLMRLYVRHVEAMGRGVEIKANGRDEVD